MINQIFRLCKLQMYNMFGINEFIHTKDKSKKKRYLMVAAVWIAIIIMLIGYVGGTTFGLITLGMGNIIPMYLYTIVSVIILMFTLFKAGSVIFAMKGYDMLISLPVSKAAVVVSRFMKMYVSNLLLSGVVMIPGVIVYGVMEKPSPLFYVVYLTGMVFLPMLPLTIASIIGAVITAISSRMRRKSIANAVLTTLFVVVFMVAGFSIPKDNVQMTMEALKGMASTIEDGISSVYPFAVWFNKAALGETVYLVGLISIPFVIFVLFVAVLQRFFLAICTLLSGVTSKNNYKIQELKVHGVVMSLWKKELKRYFASSVYVTNTIIGYILAVVAAVALYIYGLDKLGTMIGISGLKPVINVLLPFVYALLMSLTSMTSCSLSMEGKNIWLLQTLPIRTKDVYLSKILTNLTVAAPFYVVSVIMGCLTVETDIMECVWMAVIPACYIVYTAVIGITINQTFPIFNWEDEVHVVKQSMSTLISMIVGVVSCLVPAVLVGFVTWFKEGAVDVARAVIVILLMLATVVLYKRKGKKEIQDID